MTTLVSKNQEESLDVRMTGYHLNDGDLLLVGPTDEVEKATRFIQENGLDGVYFDPEGEYFEYSDYLEKSHEQGPEPYGILLYK